jgi:TonB-dependent starch-binding outer membrane protein SusC
MKLTANPASCPPPTGGSWRGAAQFLRVMKLTTIIILAACLHSSANGLAQNTITFSGKEVSLENVFNAIKKQTNYRFFFNTNMLQQASKVTIDVKNSPIEQVMNLVLKDQPLTFAIKGRTIFIMKKEEQKTSVVEQPTGDPITVSGRVTDDQGLPLVGANVKVKGSNTGVTTDNQGRFTLNNVDPSAILEISFVGHETQVLSVKGKSVLSVALGQKVGTLDETVVIAYGTTTRRFSTGNVSSVKASDIEKQPVTNPLLTLQGRVPGLVVTQENGITGGPVTIRIQGQNSLKSGNEPLIVIDGVPYPTTMLRTGFDLVLGSSSLPSGPSPLNFINPKDIESIDVLKDADATAIYGSRAANGAILITTKKGKDGPTKIDINVQKGWGKVTSLIKVLDSRQYLDMRYEAYRNDGIDWRQSSISANDLKLWDTTNYTDWQKTLIGGTSQFDNVNATVSSGTARLQYLVGATYNKTTTVFPGDFSDKRGAIHFNLNGISSNQKLKVQFSTNYMVDDNRLPGVDLTQTAIRLEPVAPTLYNEDGTLNWQQNSLGSSTWDNPLVQLLYRKYSNKTKNLVSNLTLSYNVFNGLELKGSVGYTNMQGEEYRAVPLDAVKPENRNNIPIPRSSDFGSRSMNSWIIEPQLVYNKGIGGGKLNFLMGASIQQSTEAANWLIASGYGSDQQMKSRSLAPAVSVAVDAFKEYRYNGVFSRLNYAWKDKYILNLSIRRDGSSRFGDKNKMHNFGSIGAAWIFSQENFIQKNVPFISFGKLRGSYGSTGNDLIGDYSYLNLYFGVPSPVPYQGVPGLQPSRLFNPYLQWEKTNKLQLGIDFGFLKDRILINATYALNRSSNQLLNYSLPSITGFTSIASNFPATVQNISWEFLLNTINIKNADISWSTSINLTIPKNKLVSFPNLERSSYARDYVVGQPIGIAKVNNFYDVEPTTGQYRTLDINGNPTYTPTLNDATYIAKTFPKFYGGFENSFRFKNFQLDFIFQYMNQIGKPLLFNNGSAIYPGRFLSGFSNQPITVLDRWQKPGDDVAIQKFSNTLSSASAITSNVGYTDASYLRLKNLSLSWSLPQAYIRRLKIQNLQFYMQGQNLWTITDYQGLDPEVQGITSLPPLKIWTLGIKGTF